MLTTGQRDHPSTLFNISNKNSKKQCDKNLDPTCVFSYFHLEGKKLKNKTKIKQNAILNHNHNILYLETVNRKCPPPWSFCSVPAALSSNCPQVLKDKLQGCAKVRAGKGPGAPRGLPALDALPLPQAQVTSQVSLQPVKPAALTGRGPPNHREALPQCHFAVWEL